MSTSSAMERIFEASNILIVAFIVFVYVVKTGNGQACDPGCSREIGQVQDYAASIRRDLATTDNNLDTLTQKFNTLENLYYDRVQPWLESLTAWEDRLAKNVSALKQQILDDTNAVYTAAFDMNEAVKKDLNTKVTNLTQEIWLLQSQIANLQQQPQTPRPTQRPPVAGWEGALAELYVNVSQRIINLEFGKIQNLSQDNSMWRKNFKVINSTFERMKRNNCFC